MTLKIKKQSLFDQRCILTSFMFSESVNKINFSKKVVQLFRQKFSIINIDEINESVKRIYFNFKNENSLFGQEWHSFQYYRKPLIFIYVARFLSEIDFSIIIESYISAKTKYSDLSLVNKLLLIYDDDLEAKIEEICTELSKDHEIDRESSLSDENDIIFSDNDSLSLIPEVKLIKESFIEDELIWLNKSSIEFQISQPVNSTSNLTTSKCTKINKDPLNNISVSSISTDHSNTSMMNTEISIINDRLASQINPMLKFVYNQLDKQLNNLQISLQQQIISGSTYTANESEKGSVFSLASEDMVLDPIEEEKQLGIAGSNLPSATSSTTSAMTTTSSASRLFDELRAASHGGIVYQQQQIQLQQYARRWKQAGDLALLLSQPERAYHLYKTAISFRVIQKKPLWMAGAQEGMCAAWVISIYQSANQAFSEINLNRLLSYTLENYSITPVTGISNSNNNSQISLSPNLSSPSSGIPPNSMSEPSSTSTTNANTGNNLIIMSSRKKVADIITLSELTDKFIDVINKYKKVLKLANSTPASSGSSSVASSKRYHPIHFDVCVKAGQFFVQQNLYLEAINMFKLIKGDMLEADKEMESYHILMANFYSTMGFKRKSSLHKYQRYLLYQQQLRHNPQQVTKDNEINQFEYLLSIIGDLGLNIDELREQICYATTFTSLPIYNHSQIDRKGFSSIQLKILFEIINKINNNYNNNDDNADDAMHNSSSNNNQNRPVFILSLLITLLELYGNSSGLSMKEIYSLLAISNDLYVKSNNQASQFTDSNNVQVTQLPCIYSVKPTKLPDSLLPHCDKDVSDISQEKSSVFIYTPLLKGLNRSRTTKKDELMEWVVGEDCEIVLQLYNPLPISVELKQFEVLLTEREPLQGFTEKSEIWIGNEGFNSTQKLEPRQITTLTLTIIIPTTVSYSSIYNIVKLRYKLPTIHPSLLFYNAIPAHMFDMYPIKLFPPLPLIRILSSLPSQKSFSLLPGEMHQFKLYISNESHDQQITSITSTIEEYDYVTVREYDDNTSSITEAKLRSSKLQKLILFNRQQIIDNLPLYSLSSLKMPHSPVNDDRKSIDSDDNNVVDNVDSHGASQPHLPTEAILVLKADTQNEEICNEMFNKANKNKCDFESMILWSGKFTIKFEYSNMKREKWNRLNNLESDHHTSNGSDVDDIVYVTKADANDDDDDKEMSGGEVASGFYYRLCTLNIDCVIEYGLVISDYEVDSDLNIIIEITNLSMKYKFKLDVYWCKKRIVSRPISLAMRSPISYSSLQKSHLVPQQSVSTSSPYTKHLDRSVSTDSNSASTSHKVIIPANLLDLKRLSSVSQLSDYVKEKLRMTWISTENSDDHVAQARYGKINLNYCHCALSDSLALSAPTRSSTMLSRMSMTSNTSGLHNRIVCHPLMFGLEDLFRIWIHDNLYIDMSFEDYNTSRNEPISLVEDVNKMNLFGSVHFTMNLKFKEAIPEFLTKDLVQCINVFPDVILSGIDIVNSVSTNSDTASISNAQATRVLVENADDGSYEEKHEVGSVHKDSATFVDSVTIDSSGFIGSTSLPFIISGHTSLGLTKSILSSGSCQLKGLITFLVTGCFNVCGMVTVRLPSSPATVTADNDSSNNNLQQKCHRNNRQNQVTLASSRTTQFVVSPI